MLYTRAQYDIDCAALDIISSRVTRAVANGKIGGFQANRDWAEIERAKQKLKGKLLGTVMILSDKDKKADCANKSEHTAKCKCAPLRKFEVKMAQEAK